MANKVTEYDKRKIKSMMRVPKDLLDEIDDCKIYSRETYADVVKRLIDKERRIKK